MMEQNNGADQPDVAGTLSDPEVRKKADRLHKAAEKEDAEAVDTLARELTAGCTDHWTYNVTCICRRMVGDLDGARADIACALGLSPTDPTAYKHLARILTQQGEEEAARRVLENGWRLYELFVQPGTPEEKEKYFSLREWTECD